MPDNELEEACVVAGCKPWNRRVFDEVIARYPGNWQFVGERKQLSPAILNQLNPRWIFFLHWSWLVAPEIVDSFECVCFHMTDLPFGRGGSPLQNLILRGHQTTKLTAFRMVRELDAGPVYLKEDLSLAGNAEEIYLRATYLAAHMIERIIRECPKPQVQTGDPIEFKRRNPQDSELRQPASMEKVYDFIRMLDADGYPRAFFIHEGFRYEFNRAGLYDGRIRADVTIVPVDPRQP